jgi:hypothetical protein
MLAAVLLASALAACGSSSQGNGVASKTPSEILADAKALADSASAVHVSGSLVSAGTPITLDMHLVANRGGRGRVSENGLGFEVIQIHGTVYIKGSSAFYRHVAGPAAAQLLRGRWLKASASNASLGSLASLTDLHQLLDTTLTEHGALVKGAVTTVNGRKVIGLTDNSKGGTLYVAATGPPYPIEVTKGGTGGGTIVFDNWNQAVAVTAPADAIDIAQLQAGH